MVDNAKILLTVYYRGRLMGNMSKKLNKNELSKVKRSPFERALESGKGYIIPKGLYLSPSDHEDREVSTACRKTTLSESTYNYLISDNTPDKFNTFKGRMAWHGFSERERLEWHLSQMAEGNGFSYELID